MHRKHYVAIAKVINRMEMFDVALIHKHALLAGLCEIFREDNPSFDEARFRKACGAEGSI